MPPKRVPSWDSRTLEDKVEFLGSLVSMLWDTVKQLRYGLGVGAAETPTGDVLNKGGE